MAHPKQMKFTNASVKAQAPASAGQVIIRDSELRNFFLVVGKATRSYAYQVDTKNPVTGKRKTVRKTIGRADEWSADEARKVAKLRIAGLQTGHTKPADKAVTLGGAWAAFEAQFSDQVAQGTKSAASLRSYRHAIEDILDDWQDAKLRDLSDGTKMVATRHREITQAHGKASANVTMRCLRIVYNFARKNRLEKGLPAELPTDAIVWNKQTRRDTGMAQEDLAGWYQLLRKLRNPIREEFHLLTLLSGSRPNALRQARWKWFDREAQTLTFPASVMKGHASFIMPVSTEMVACLDRAHEAGRMMYPEAAKTFIFAGRGAAGHLADYTEDRKRLPKWGGDLRQSWVNASKAIGLGGYEARCLLDHAVGDVHDGYATRGGNGLLLDAQKKVSRYLWEGLTQ